MSGDRELGASLRAARERAGLTLAQVARYVPCTRGQLANMEAGRRTIYPHVPLAYERAAREADMNRRGLMTGLGATLVAPQAAGELLRHGFVAALGKRHPSIDEWQHKLDVYGHDYMSKGATVVQRDIAGDLAVLPQSLDMPPMWGIAGKTMAIYGKTTAGPREAIEWYRLAVIAAERSRDVETRVWVAGRAALALGYEGAAAPTALALAEQALQLSDSPTPGRLNALMGKAHVHAQRGQAREAREVWNEARRVYDILSPDDEISDFNYPYWRFAVVGSLLHSRLGDARAEHWQADCERHRPASMVRFVTHIELHRGLMMAREGDRTRGIAYAEAALAALPEEKRSQSLTLMLDEIKATPG